MTIDSPFIGKWRIIEMEAWSPSQIEMVTPGQINFNKAGTGQLHFVAFNGEIDWRTSTEPGKIEFSFEGFDEGNKVSGRGWAKMGQGRINGHVYFHMGDDSSFVALKIA